MDSNEVGNIVKDLQAVVWNGFRQSPYVDDVYGVFRSHYDWHSSVHGHWTLLSSLRHQKDDESLQKILNRFSESALLIERDRLNNKPQFELPYGQAWLLLLIRELELQQNSSQTLRILKSETVSRIGHWLEANEVPEKNPNSYHSWLITYFLFKKSKSDLEYPRASSIDKKFSFITSVNDKDDPKDFFSSESLFQILKNQPKASSNLSLELDELGAITASNCHHLGKIISLSWVTPQNNRDSLKNSLEFTKEVLKRPSLWKQNFETVSHWIPQFLWLGLWLSLGEP